MSIETEGQLNKTEKEAIERAREPHNRLSEKAQIGPNIERFYLKTGGRHFPAQEETNRAIIVSELIDVVLAAKFSLEAYVQGDPKRVEGRQSMSELSSVLVLIHYFPELKDILDKIPPKDEKGDLD